VYITDTVFNNSAARNGALAISESSSMNMFSSTVSYSKGVGLFAEGVGASSIVEDCDFENTDGSAVKLIGKPEPFRAG